jgi:hypothetical protein
MLNNQRVNTDVLIWENHGTSLDGFSRNNMTRNLHPPEDLAK